MKQKAKQLLNFIDKSPSPWHAVQVITQALDKHHFQALDERQAWPLEAKKAYYVVRDGSSIIAFIIGEGSLEQNGFHIMAAHTDSPGLRIKPNAAQATGEMVRLGVEIYGGPILATFTDRDLSLAGRIAIKTPHAIEERLLQFQNPLVRIPNVAIHLNPKVNEIGLKLNPQEELPLILSVLQKDLPAEKQFRSILADKLAVETTDILSWELQVFDTQKGCFFGTDEQFIANGQLDNLASCHAGLSALLDENNRYPEATNVIAFFDHEEVGSKSYKGANSAFLPNILERISLCLSLGREAQMQAHANSFLISADMAHAYHPNYKQFYDEEHKAIINGGPAIKINAKQRYTSDTLSEAFFMQLCEQAQVPYQKIIHHTNLRCGSTVGPFLAANLGIRSVDVGNPLWSMHSARESAGTFDHHYMIQAMNQFFKR